MNYLKHPVRASLLPALFPPVLGAWVAPTYLGLHWALGWLVGANLSAYLVWALDKRLSKSKKKSTRRVPEWTLHGLTLAGGGVGAVIAMRTLRHKTRKRLFRLAHPPLAALGIAALGWLAWR